LWRESENLNRVAIELDTGFFIYCLDDKLRIVNILLFEARVIPKAYCEPKREDILAKIKRLFT